MNIEEMKKDLDAFDRELFYGFSKFVLANLGEEKAGLFGKVINDVNKELRKSDPKTNLISVMLDTLTDYRENKLDENTIRNLYNTIITYRSHGVIIHDNTTISSLKMEKLNAEDKSHRLEKENELLAEELSRCRSILDSKKATMEAIK